MDPLLAALVAGAAAASKDLVAQAVKDAYAGLKFLITRKFGQKADVEGAIKSLEKNPDSESRQGVLKEELEQAEAGQDQELLAQAREFLALLKEHGADVPTYQADLRGSGAIAQGKGARAAGERGVIVEGDASGNIVTGDKNVVKDEE